ncbi:hypothetical protein [Candidatus Nitrosotalea okcheonensis]|uniref:YtkA-like domain-containing protein n=1 Tax=Candidatus Nitrosotalea okcheonensis TaxID=1903276 RepID=A0A2H1FCN3_9ARCH|nr:hypothetical protein [Candidatus Nitrosotalea okcheonensis]MDE1831086.1 hypothetical protein [Nitrososphaerota archaeon]MDE1840576.1 hypothetical protein [Nitrososphaerota archaeon]MDE1877240.1 hypothetical protein [Nitrososphaerota archaeon]SMH70526.1 conserved protein of unknown function [Candidatus Nitrosotalea okcheonensis]
MRKRFYLLLPIYLSFFIGLGIYEIIHPPFSTDSSRIGDYEVQVGTTPPVPEVGKDTTLHFLVLDQNENPVDNFRMGVQIYYNDEIVGTFPPANHDYGKWDLDYTFKEPGNHVIRASLVDFKNGGTLSYTFNVGVLNFYMNVFTYLIIAGLSGAGGIVIAIILFQKKLWFKKSKT